MRRLARWGGPTALIWVFGCGGGDEGANAIPPGERGTVVALEWSPCGEIECAEVMVPLDRNDPEGETISIAINRVRANDTLPYRGVLLINPGDLANLASRTSQHAPQCLAPFPSM